MNTYPLLHRTRFLILFLLTILMFTECKKDEQEEEFPNNPPEMRLKEIKVYSNDTLFLRKTMNYDDQNRLDEIFFEVIDQSNIPSPFQKHKFDYISDDNIESAYFRIAGNEWIEDIRFARLYESGSIVEYTASYSNEAKAFYTYNAFGLSTVQYLSIPFKGFDTCTLEEYLYDGDGVLKGVDVYHFCKLADSAARKIRYVRDEQGLLKEIEIYARYLTGEWEMNSKLEFVYDLYGRVVECLNHKYYKKTLTPISKYSFEYFTDGTLKQFLYTKLSSGKTERYILSYEAGKGNFHEMRSLYNYPTYGIWMPDINLSGHFPFYY